MDPQRRLKKKSISSLYASTSSLHTGHKPVKVQCVHCILVYSLEVGRTLGARLLLCTYNKTNIFRGGTKSQAIWPLDETETNVWISVLSSQGFLLRSNTGIVISFCCNNRVFHQAILFLDLFYTFAQRIL